MNCFVYVKDLIGVETNLKKFKWSLGTDAPEASPDEYEKCLVRVRINVKKDSEVFDGSNLPETSGRFRYFHANEGEHTVFFKRRIFKLINLNYSVSVNGNFAEVVVGRTYYRLIKYKIMNIHPIWYVIFDVVTALLLANGYSPLYCSAVESSENKAVVFMAPPNMGKSLTALRMCSEYSAKLIAEDMAITDGTSIWPVPYTNTYRDYKEYSKSNIFVAEEPVKVSNVVVLERGRKSAEVDEPDMYKKVLILNRYGLGYMKSPALSALEYFNRDFMSEELLNEEAEIIKKILHNTDSRVILAENASEYAEEAASVLS